MASVGNETIRADVLILGGGIAGVWILDELRRAGITKPILSFGGFWKGQETACLQHRLTPVVYRLDMIESLIERSCRIMTVVVEEETRDGGGEHPDDANPGQH